MVSPNGDTKCGLPQERSGMISLAPPRANPPVSRFFSFAVAIRARTFRETGGINRETGVFATVILTSFFNLAVELLSSARLADWVPRDSRIEFRETRGLSSARLADLAENVAVISRLSRGYLAVISRLSCGYLAVISRLSRGYLAVISRFAENRVAVKRETRARTTTEVKHDPIYDYLPLQVDQCVVPFINADSFRIPYIEYAKNWVYSLWYTKCLKARPARTKALQVFKPLQMNTLGSNW